MRFEVFVAVQMWIVVFWVLTPCRLVGGYESLTGALLLPAHAKSVFLPDCDNHL